MQAGVKRGQSEQDASGTVKRFKGEYTTSERRKRHLDSIHTEFTPDKEDKKISKSVVHNLVISLMGNICRQKGGEIYKNVYVDAGSHPINAKIGKADEFDVNILMNIDVAIVQRGAVPYEFKVEETYQSAYTSYCPQTPRSSGIYSNKAVLVQSHQPNPIPLGYAVIELHNAAKAKEKLLPGKFFHWIPRPYAFPNSNVLLNKSSSGNIHLIPQDVKEDLHEKVKANYIRDVVVDETCHGPAVTLTIKPEMDRRLKHVINLDMTPSVKVDTSMLSFKMFGWPRPESTAAFGKELVDNTIDAGIHLVPKKDLFWFISFSRAERALLKSVDNDYGCRKYVFKLLKAFVSRCKGSPGNNFDGMSHIIKTQILRSCENHCYDDGYWNKDRKDVCVINTLSELLSTLRLGSHIEYFSAIRNEIKVKEMDRLIYQLDRILRELESMT